MHITQAQLDQPAHAAAVLDLLDMYSRHEFGSGAPLPADVRDRLLERLAAAGGIALLAERDGRYVGLAICLPSFSSFRARPILNIHDLAVSPDCRGQGIGKALLAAAEAEARRRGCTKLTLEVRSDNAVAMELYRRSGYRGTEPETFFWSRDLESDGGSPGDGPLGTK